MTRKGHVWLLGSALLLLAGACGARSALDPLSPRERAALAAEGDGTIDAGGGGPLGSGGGSDGSGPGSGTGSSDGKDASAHGGSGTPVGSACGESSGTSPPSCSGGDPGQQGCGACNESCCATFDVIGGTYYRTYQNDGTGPTGEADLATISNLSFDRYLVTVGRFRQFVAAWNAGYTPPIGGGKHSHLNGGQGLAAAGSPGMYEPGWSDVDTSWLDPNDMTLTQCGAGSTWTSAPGANEALPINCLNWWEGFAFCIWDGGFLPSEAEWEFAAAGGDQQRAYPWGSQAPGTTNEYAIFGFADDGGQGCYFPTPETCVGSSNIGPVGAAAKGAGRYGQLDIAGNVEEWTLDWFAPYVDPCVDCAQVEPLSVRTIRGGSYDLVSRDLTPWFRGDGLYPPGRSADVGVRCARPPS